MTPVDISDRFETVENAYMNNSDGKMVYTSNHAYCYKVVPKMDRLTARVAFYAYNSTWGYGMIQYADDNDHYMGGQVFTGEIGTSYTDIPLVFPKGATKAYVNSATRCPPIIIQMQRVKSSITN